MITLEILNKEINLANAKIVLNKSAYILTDWLSRFVTFSERLIVPRVYFMKFGEFYNFKVKDNGQILFSGYAMLLAENNIYSSEIQLIDSSKFLFDKMQNLLSNIQLDSYDFVFSTSEYNNKKILNSSVWLWSAANFHENRTLSNNILSGNLAFSRPFFSVRRIIEKIFSDNGWAYTLSENANQFDSLIVSSNHNNFYFTSYEKIYNLTETIVTSYTIDFSTPNFIKTDTVSASYTLNLNYNSKIRLRGKIDASQNMLISIVANSSGATDSMIQNFVIQKGLNEYDLTSNELKTGDPTYDVNIYILGNGDIEFIYFQIYTIIKENDFGDINLANFTDFKVKTYDNIPNIKQIDLFKHALIFCGGFFTTENFKKQLNINSLTELSKLSSLDWSLKFVENSERKTQLEGLARRNILIYNNSDTKNIETGNSFFEISNNTFPDLIDIYNCIFEASPEVAIDSQLMLDTPLYSDIERINESNILLGYYELTSGKTIARFENLNFDKLLSSYYNDFITALQKSEFYEANFILSKSDFYNFDFTRLIYISQLKANFYVISFDGYFENEQTKLLLLKS